MAIGPDLEAFARRYGAKRVIAAGAPSHGTRRPSEAAGARLEEILRDANASREMAYPTEDSGELATETPAGLKT